MQNSTEYLSMSEVKALFVEWWTQDWMEETDTEQEGRYMPGKLRMG